MNPGRIPILGLMTLALIAIVAGAMLLSRGERRVTEPGQPEAGSAPLGWFMPASPPYAAPQLGFTDITGQRVSLSDFAGKVVLVNLWATWCAPCRREMPSLEKLQTRFGDKLAILAISEDIGGRKVVAPFIEKLGLRVVKIYLDPKSSVGQGFNVDGLPTTILIDRHGRVVGRVEGEADWTSPKFLAAVEPLVSADNIVKTPPPAAHP
jgi:thiol-disulfide isomerase/thioredoxin